MAVLGKSCTLIGGAVVLCATLAGCVIAPAQAPAQPLIVAYPGPGKTEPLFRQDNAICLAAVGSTQTASTQAASTQAASTKPGAPPPSGSTLSSAAAATPLPDQLPSPGQAYLRCMSARGNVIQPVQQDVAVTYGWYPSYPIYANHEGYYPWLYGVGFGYGYGGYGYGGYGYREGFGGYRGGFREGGFGREGGGFHGRGGGFGGRR